MVLLRSTRLDIRMSTERRTNKERMMNDNLQKIMTLMKSNDLTFRDQGCELLLALDSSEQQAFFEGVVLNDDWTNYRR